MNTATIKQYKETMGSKIDKTGNTVVDFLERVGTAIINHPVRFGLIMGSWTTFDTIVVELATYGVIVSPLGWILYGATITFVVYYLVAKFFYWVSLR